MLSRSPVVDAVLAEADAGFERSLERLFDLMRIPSISTDAAYKPDCRRAAEWAAAELNQIGFDARVAETAGQPMVVGHRKPTGAQRHVLFYGHYDVQPVDPLPLWNADPFSPTIVDGPRGKQIFGRGSSDDKGQLLTFVEAMRAWMAAAGELPIAVSILLEGEEESGSTSLPAFLKAQHDELKADLVLVCDTTQWDPQTPAITTRLRGMLYEEITITAPSRDLHSGMYGGPALNPIRVLSRLIAGLHDEQGRVTVPHFYDGVDDLSPAVAAQWKALGFDEKSFLGDVGLTHASGETGHSVLELLWARPTCDVNGIIGGYTAEGAKTVIPSKASAKISFRLVSRQNPDVIRESFRDYMRAQLPPDARIEFQSHGGSAAIELPVDDPALAAAARALEEEWGRPAILMGAGGSIPIVGAFKRELGMDALLVGFAQDDDRIHSPNEKYELTSFHKGIRSWVRIADALAGLP